jgi:two-component system nitrogen regulation sensor histidine kinase NtrY
MAYLIDGQGKLLATAASLAESPYRAPPQEAMNMAKNGQVIVIAPGQTNMVGAIKSLQNFNDTYLYVIRPVNARVLQQLRATRASVAEYQLLEQRRAGVQVAFGLMYVAIALTLLLSAIWIGMWFANQHHDLGAQKPARRVGRRQHGARRAASLHGSGVVGCHSRRGRRRQRWHRHPG